MTLSPVRLVLLGSAALATAANSFPGEVPVVRTTRQAEFVFNLLPRLFQRRVKLEVWVVTERTELGRALRPATPETPHYVSVVFTEPETRGEGAPVREHAMPGALSLTLTEMLADQSLQPGSAEHPAGTVLSCTWGTHHRAESRTVVTGYSRSSFSNVGFHRGLLEPYGARSVSPGGWTYGTGDNGGLTVTPSFRSSTWDSPSAEASGGPIEENVTEIPAPMSHADLCERAALLVGEEFAREMRARLASLPKDELSLGKSWEVVRDAALRHPRGQFLLRTM